MKLHIHSLQETQEFAKQLASLCHNKQIVITLDGDLGAGKTTWTQAFGSSLGITQTINSPTFTILKSYTQGNGQPFHHMDAYRLEGASQDLGFEDCFDEGICIIEWANFIEDQLPQDRIEISMQQGDQEQERWITLLATGPKSQEIVEAIQ